MNLCGVCNHEVIITDEQIFQKEEDGSITYVHMKCEHRIPEKTCKDCGHHRLICSECAEF